MGKYYNDCEENNIMVFIFILALRQTASIKDGKCLMLLIDSCTVVLKVLIILL